VIDLGLSAGEAIGDILKQMKEKSVAAQATDLSTDQRNALVADFNALRNQIDQIANSATFNGINLVNAASSNLSVLTSDLLTGASGRQVQSTVEAGYVPGLSSYIVGHGAAGNLVAANDTAIFTIGGSQVGNFTITATMTVAEYLSAVSTSTGGRVSATYNQSNGQFTYVAAEATAGSDLTVTGSGTRSWLGQGVAATAASGTSSSTSITDLDLTVGGTGALASIGALTLDTAANATAASSAITAAIDTLNVQLASMGSQAKALDVQKTFLGKLSDTVEKGIGSLVDADLAKESARLQALQVKQQLGAQALSIANSAPSIILSFFR
jgi:flagellin